MLRLVFRPLLVILTLGALLVAMFQVAGRVAFMFLDDLERPLNQMLSDRGIQVSGLSGDWRMLNPVVLAERVDLPAGHLEGVVLELDMVETVFRGTLLARRLRVSDAHLTVEKARGEPWRLKGAAGADELDPLPLLRDSDQVEVTGRLAFHRLGTEPAAIRVRLLGINRGGEHRHRLELENQADDCRDDCVLRADLHHRDSLWPFAPGTSRLTAESRGFLLPRPVLGFSPLEIARLEVGWQRNGPQSGGSVRLRTEQFHMPGDVRLALDLAGTVRGRQGIHAGSVTEWRVEQGDDVWRLPELAVNADSDLVSVWMPSLDLRRAGTFLRQALAAVGPAERWLGALNLNGTARNLRLAYGLDGSGLKYALTVDGVSIDGFKGVPTVRNAGGELFGYERGVQLNLNAQNMELAFPDVFTGEWSLPYAQGVLQAWFAPDYFGVRGLSLRAETGGTRAAGGFAMTRPPDREGQRLLMLVSTERMSVAQAQEFVPYRLPEDLKTWLLTAPRAGTLEDARLAYQGQFQEEPGELGRRVALAARMRGAEVRYHADWPVVTGLDGHLGVAGSLVEVDVDRGVSAGAQIGGSQVQVVDNAAAANVSLDADTRADAVLEFLRTTPLRQWVTFVEPDWQAGGPMRLSGELYVPLNPQDEEAEPAVRLRGDLEGVDLQMPGYRMALEALKGSFRYRYPYQVDASEVTGRLFGEPVMVTASTDDDRVHFVFAGRARPDDVWRVIDMADPGVASGAFDFEADLGIGVTEGATSRIDVSSTLEGTGISLPGGYGKTPEAAVPAAVTVTFLPAYNRVSFDYRDAGGWLHMDEVPRRGAVGFGAGPVAEGETGDELVLNGRVAGFDLDEVIPDGEGETLPLPIRLASLQVGEIAIGNFAVTGVGLDGRISNDALDLTVDSAEVSGTLARRGDAPMEVSLSQVTVPAGDEGADPLEPAVIAELPAADVEIGQLNLGEEDYGSWRFQLRPAGGNLEVRDLEASVRGVAIDSPEGLLWRGDVDETHFEGRLVAGNMADVLPQWGYAPNVETERASLSGAFTWSGSPLMVDMMRLRGEAEAEALDGRFLDVESGAGAQKIFSLLNFTAIAKRVTLNFSDVFGRGVSFDELNAEFTLDEGLLTFLEPMHVQGTGGEFRVTGTVDLEERELDNEMIVTLPVSKSLPWYAAYVALANPLAGLGVLVGERVLRKPLEQFSSARYHIGGTLDDPNVRFLSVFDVIPPDEAGEAPGVADAGTTQSGVTEDTTEPSAPSGGDGGSNTSSAGDSDDAERATADDPSGEKESE